MPVKENESPGTVFMYGSDGTRIILNEIPVFDPEIESDTEMQKAITEFQKPMSLDFSMYLIMPPGDLFAVLCGLCTLEQIQQNNWRRLHGLPMRRGKWNQ